MRQIRFLPSSNQQIPALKFASFIWPHSYGLRISMFMLTAAPNKLAFSSQFHVSEIPPLMEQAQIILWEEWETG